MKKIIIFLVALIISTSVSANLHAKNYKMVIFYPGEQGSTLEAEPVLDAFFEYLNKKLTGSKFSGKYFNSTQSGLGYIRNSRPPFGIVSWIALKENEGAVPKLNPILSTRPFPHGATKDTFTLVGYLENKEDDWNPPANLVIYSSIPMSLAFLKSRLLPNFKGSASIQNTNTMLMTLKKIASGENPNQVALLTPMEKHTLDNMKGEWTEKLATLRKCTPIPTAQLGYFGSEKPAITDELVKVLTLMPNDPEGAEILETMRLKGFQ